MFDHIAAVIARTGYAGITALMLLENLFPPLPSELIMPMAGFVAADGRLQFVGVVLAGALGSVLGALPWYYVGRRLGAERLKRWAARHGRWLTITPEQVDRVDQWFVRHCGSAVLLGRMIPAGRTMISVPAGLFRMPPGRFVAFTALGSLGWSAALAAAGYLLRDGYDRVEQYLNPVTSGIVGLLVIGYLYRLITWRPHPPVDARGSSGQHGADRPGDQRQDRNARSP